MLTVREKLELEELEELNKKIDKEMTDDNYEYDNRFGAVLLLVSYCGIGIFMVYKVAELLVKRFS